MKKTCYICLPISGNEKTAIERANKAADYVKKTLGYIPLTPMEINTESQETLDNPNRPIEYFMGNDIRALIGECDAIYMCKGWECSKGCNVEHECAVQYGKTIFYEETPLNNGFIEVVRNRFEKIVHEYRGANELHGPGSLEVNVIKRCIDNYKKFMEDWFDLKI